MQPEKGRVFLALVPGKAEPSDKSELVTELLFGEAYEVLDQSGNWLLVRCEHDGYECWIDTKLAGEDEHSTYKWMRNTSHDARLITTEHEVIRLPFGCMIPQPANWVWRGRAFQLVPAQKDLSELREIASSFLYAPYRWGGRSALGIDCSGFVQNVFLALGIPLKRDAWQQAEQGELISFVEEVRDGDLAFFENADGRISHVGIALRESESDLRIIHASGYVRIDVLDHEGIFRKDTSGYSHKLRLIRRVM